MSVCDKLISKCVQVDCNSPMFAGLNKRAIIFNKDQIESLTFQECSNIINGITMKTYEVTSEDPQTHEPVTTNVAYCGYTVEQLGNTPYEGTQIEMEETNVGNRFTETVRLLVADNNPDICKNVVDALASGRFLVIVENDYVNSTGDNKYQVYGSGRGLQASAIVREAYGDNEGAYDVTLTQPKGTRSGVFFYSTSLSATDTAIENLICSSCASQVESC